jgi:YidC/Oxa1 family membrane protein insertase
MFSLFGVPVDAAYHVVTAISTVLAPIAGGLAVAAAIVVFTIAVRLLILPFSYYALRGQFAQARIAPQVQALRQRYAKQPERLSRELKALYAEQGTSMLAGCLPLLLQWPFLSVMYLLFRSSSVGGAPNTLLAHYLFGARLGSHWLAGTGPLSAQGAVFAGLFLLLGVIGWLAARSARRVAGPAPATTTSARVARRDAAPPSAAQPAGVPPWVTSLLPYLTAVFAAFLPLAAGLYLLTTTAWTLLERVVLRRVLLARDGGAPVSRVASGGGTASGGPHPRSRRNGAIAHAGFGHPRPLEGGGRARRRGGRGGRVRSGR